MFRYLPLIVKNCWRNRRRTTLTIVSIGVSMCLLGVLIAVYHALYLSDATPDQALRLVTRNRVSFTVFIPRGYQAQIEHVPGYKDARDPKNFFARFGVDPPENLFTIFGELKIPDDQKQAFLHDRTGTVIGRDLANKFGFRLGDRITLIGDIYPGTLDLTVRGIFDSPRKSEMLYFNWAYVREGLSESRKGEVGTFDILCDSAGVVPRVAKTIDDEFHNAPVQTRTETEQAFLLSFVSMLGNVKMFLISICAAVMFTILLVSGNTMAMSVRERVREVGVLKTLGFTGGNILFIILGEAVAISIAGGVVGFLLSTILVGGVQSSPAGMFLPPIQRFDPAVGSVCIGVALGIGLLSSFIPAFNASRTNIVEALRSTD